MSTKNLACIFKKVPKGWPTPGEHLTVEDIGFDLDQDAPENGLIVEVQYLSLDPYMRGRLVGPEAKNYAAPFTLNDPINGGGLAKVLKSNAPDISEGDVIIHHLPFQQYAVVNSKDGKFRKVDAESVGGDIRHWLGALGGPGWTAYASLYAIGKPKKGEMIFISSAAGAVGQVVGELAKREGLKVIGSVGSDEKLDYIIKDLGFDGGWNYKKEDADSALNRLAPDGKIDIYYDNVGAEQLEAAINHLNNYGRIVACGMIADYNREEKYPIRNLMQFIGKRLTMTGFIVSDPQFGGPWKEEHQTNVSKWLKDGSFKGKTHEWVGMEKAPEALIGMWRGENFGKAVLKLAP
ncbi:putative oxidoreductase [Tothia fuscella]|uniref:Oxidoreductase n=1 Tax=Tothia fuscella TaxID=1048955 RepID=A0A9P4TTW7_9PEZI|nr:putative oxidoreductase [Tothia fuscella]